MQAENKIKHKILCLFRRLLNHLAAWLHNGPVVINARPIHQDIHLNSAEAIGHWLAAIDQPCAKLNGVSLVYTPTLAVDDSPLCAPLGMIDWQQFSLDLSNNTPSDSATRYEGGGASDEESE